MSENNESAKWYIAVVSGNEPKFVEVIDECFVHRMDDGTDHIVIENEKMVHGTGIIDPTVSRKHLHMKIVKGVLCVRDLGSTNGTLIDGIMIPMWKKHMPMDKFVPLKGGEHLMIGRSTILKIEREANTITIRKGAIVTLPSKIKEKLSEMGYETSLACGTLPELEVGEDIEIEGVKLKVSKPAENKTELYIYRLLRDAKDECLKQMDHDLLRDIKYMLKNHKDFLVGLNNSLYERMCEIIHCIEHDRCGPVLASNERNIIEGYLEEFIMAFEEKYLISI